MLVRKSSCSPFAATILILHGAIINCSSVFPVSIRCPRHVGVRSMPSTPALISPDQARALSIAWKFLLEFCIRKSSPSLLRVGPMMRGLFALLRNRLEPSEHVIGFRGLKRQLLER